jgi:predicted site-specific integrase-resolvase
LRALKQPIANDHLSQKRYAGAGLRDAGKYSVAIAARERRETIARLRTESKKKRDELKQQIKALTPALTQAIAEADAEYDKVVTATAAVLK